MAHKRRPRFKERSKAADMLVTTDNVVRVPAEVFLGDDRANIVPRMSLEEKMEVVSIITSRRDSARETTDEIAAKMDKWDKQYNGEWLSPEIDDEKIYLPKTREQVDVIKAYILLLVSQLDPLVVMMPEVSSIWASDDEYRRAKVMEALFDYYANDKWKLRDDVFPKWLKAFLKNTMAVWKVTYREDNFLPDLNIEVIDRALLYIDPIADDIKNARWIIEKYLLPRSEVLQRIEDGHWYAEGAEFEKVMSNSIMLPDDTMRRFFGNNYHEKYSVEEDELIEVWDYWQAPTKGLDDAYGVILGGENGELVRYGRNPYPYKGIPYRGKSYDPDEFLPDGTGLVEQYTPFQELVNNLLNMRITDVRANIIRPVATIGRYVDEQTMQDFKDGQKMVRLSEEAYEASLKDPNFDVRKQFAELPFRTTTGELLTGDLPFILGQGKESSQLSDVFRGQAPAVQATLGQIQEQLNRNQGVFRPIYLQVMRGFEELAEICMEYFKDPSFFPTSRIIQVIGKNKYEDVIENWHNPGGNMFVREVTADETDVDVTMNAVNAADALASRTFLINSFEQIFQSIGQIPEMYQDLKKTFDFSRVVEFMLNNSGHDVEAIKMSPKQQQEKAQEQQQKQQQDFEMQKVVMELQAQMKTLEEQGKSRAKAEGQIMIDSNKADLDSDLLEERVDLESEARIQEIVVSENQKLTADIKRMMTEFTLEAKSDRANVGHGENINK